MNVFRIAAIAAAVFFFALSSAEARGSCDGIHRCRCGSTQTAHFGLPRIFNGHNLWQAAEWPRAFPRTTPHIGAVMYQHGGGPTGHVSRIVGYSGGCTATVSDDAGTYERNICSRGAQFVEVDNFGMAVASESHHRRRSVHTYSARRHQHRTQVASADYGDWSRNAH